MANEETSEGKPDTADPSAPVGTWSRRDFLKLVGYGVVALLSGCSLPPVTEPPELEPTALPPLSPTAAPRGDVATATLTAQPRELDTGQVFQSPPPEPSATPDRVASFEIPADHAPWWAFLGNVAKKTVTLEGKDFALYRAVFQPYLLDTRLERINNNQVVVATAIYEVSGEKKVVEVIFEPNITFYSNWTDHVPILGLQDEVIPIERLIQDVENWVAGKKQVALYVVIGYGGIPKEVSARNCTPVECGVVDDILLQMNPRELLEFYKSGGESVPQNGKVRLLVTTVGFGPNDLQQTGEISPWPADQIRQFPFDPNP